MVTTVGMQSEIASAMTSLLELEYDALEAYKVAVDKLEDIRYKSQMQKFMHDHERHVLEIEKLLKKHNVEFSAGPSAKQILTKGKVIIADLIGDKAILVAMLTNETDTNTAYERMLERNDDWADAYEVLQRGLADEKRHKEWLEENMPTLN